MCFLQPSRPLLLAARQRLIHRCRQRELRGVLGLLCLLIGCQDASLKHLKHPPCYILDEGDSYTSTTSICAYARVHSRVCQKSTSHTSRGLRSGPTFFPWSVKAKFHTKIPSTFYTTHKNSLTPPKMSSVSCVSK